MSLYEILVIHTPVLTPEETRAKIDQLKEVVTKNGGEISREDVWGRRRLAYMIGSQREGHYTLIEFESPTQGTCLAELDRFCKIDEAILRHLVTRAVVGKSKGLSAEEMEQRSRERQEARAQRANATMGGRGGERNGERRGPSAEVEEAPDSEGVVPGDEQA